MTDPVTVPRREALAAVCARHGVALCYLFGSQVEGYADARSDWDIGVIFEPGRLPEYTIDVWLALLEDLETIFPRGRVDLIFLQRAPARIQNAAIHGLLLYARTDRARADFEEDVMRRWMDLRPFIEASERDEAEAIRSGHFIVRP
ncbi:MAG: nucleotidyltransferase domain-containing protein [Armatimonadetes bacterium]|nr:nucleotidyltransferase domain-containing protein [Armatimonadota bacterium]